MAAAAVALRDMLPSRAVWVSSPERKALETLQLAVGDLDASILTDGRFGEVVRPDEPFDDEVVPRRQAWVSGRLDERHAGWETPLQAAARFQAAVSDHSAIEPLVIGTHGMVLMSWLISVGRIPAGEPAADAWSGLRYPDVVRITV